MGLGALLIFFPVLLILIKAMYNSLVSFSSGLVLLLLLGRQTCAFTVTPAQLNKQKKQTVAKLCAQRRKETEDIYTSVACHLRLDYSEENVFLTRQIKPAAI